VLACASLLAASHYAAARTTHGGKGSSAATAKAAGKIAKSAGKKAAGRKSKSKDDQSASKTAVPQIPLSTGPTPQTSAAEIAHVKSAIEALRHGGASKATEVAATISDPVGRKLVEWMILRSDHSGGDSKRFLAFIAANPGWPNLTMFRKRAEAMLWNENPKPAQVLSFFHGYFDQHQYFPLLVFDGETGFPLAAWLRPGTVHASCGAVDVLRGIVTQLRAAWPGVLILIRGDTGFAGGQLGGRVRAEGGDDHAGG
jgi:hypothetical protein